MRLMNDSTIPVMRRALKNLCESIIKRLETEQGRSILARTTSSFRNGLVDKFHMITEESVKEMIVVHSATIPVFDTLFGLRPRHDPITVILNEALSETLDIDMGENG